MPSLILTSEIEELPLDPRQRFVALEEIVRLRYEELIADEQTPWRTVQDARLSFMSTIVGAAKALKIEPISLLEIPKKTSWDDSAYEDFKNELDFYLIQLALQGAEDNHKLSISLEGTTRAKIQTLIYHIREQVEKLDIQPGKIDRLLDRLKDFEKELERPRLSFALVGGFILFFAGAVSDFGGAAEQIRHLVHQVEVVIGVAKEEQDRDAIGRIAQKEFKQLEPPRKKEPEPGPAQNFDLDDEIPF